MHPCERRIWIEIRALTEKIGKRKLQIVMGWWWYCYKFWNISKKRKSMCNDKNNDLNLWFGFVWKFYLDFIWSREYFISSDIYASLQINFIFHLFLHIRTEEFYQRFHLNIQNTNHLIAKYFNQSLIVFVKFISPNL